MFNKNEKIIWITVIVLLLLVSAYLIGYNLGFMFGYYEGHLGATQYAQLNYTSK